MSQYETMKTYAVEIVAKTNKATDEIAKLEKELRELSNKKGLTQGLQSDIDATQESINGLKGDLASTVKAINDKLDDIHTDKMVSEFKNMSGQIESYIGDIKGEIATLQSSIEGLENSDFGGLTKGIQNEFEKITTIINAFSDDYKDVMDTIRNIKTGSLNPNDLIDVKGLDNANKLTSMEIAKLKKTIEDGIKELNSASKRKTHNLNDLLLGTDEKAGADEAGQRVYKVAQAVKKAADKLERNSIDVTNFFKGSIDTAKIAEILSSTINEAYIEANRVISDSNNVEVRFKYILNDPDNAALKSIKDHIQDDVIKNVQEYADANPIKIPIGYKTEISKELDEDSKAELAKASVKEEEKGLIKSLNLTINPEVKGLQGKINNIIDDINLELQKAGAKKIEVEVVGKVNEKTIGESAQNIQDEIEYQQTHGSVGKPTGSMRVEGDNLATESTLLDIKGILSNIQGNGVNVNNNVQPSSTNASDDDIKKEIEAQRAMLHLNPRRRSGELSANKLNQLELVDDVLMAIDKAQIKKDVLSKFSTLATNASKNNEELINSIIEIIALEKDNKDGANDKKIAELKANGVKTTHGLLSEADSVYYTKSVNDNGVDIASYGDGLSLDEWQTKLDEEFYGVVSSLVRAKNDIEERYDNIKANNGNDVITETKFTKYDDKTAEILATIEGLVNDQFYSAEKIKERASQILKEHNAQFDKYVSDGNDVDAKGSTVTIKSVIEEWRQKIIDDLLSRQQKETTDNEIEKYIKGTYRKGKLVKAGHKNELTAIQQQLAQNGENVSLKKIAISQINKKYSDMINEVLTAPEITDEYILQLDEIKDKEIKKAQNEAKSQYSVKGFRKRIKPLLEILALNNVESDEKGNITARKATATNPDEYVLEMNQRMKEAKAETEDVYNNLLHQRDVMQELVELTDKINSGDAADDDKERLSLLEDEVKTFAVRVTDQDRLLRLQKELNDLVEIGTRNGGFDEKQRTKALELKDAITSIFKDVDEDMYNYSKDRLSTIEGDLKRIENYGRGVQNTILKSYEENTKNFSYKNAQKEVAKRSETNTRLGNLIKYDPNGKADYSKLSSYEKQLYFDNLARLKNLRVQIKAYEALHASENEVKEAQEKTNETVEEISELTASFLPISQKGQKAYAKVTEEYDTSKYDKMSLEELEASKVLVEDVKAELADQVAKVSSTDSSIQEGKFKDAAEALVRRDIQFLQDALTNALDEQKADIANGKEGSARKIQERIIDPLRAAISSLTDKNEASSNLDIANQKLDALVDKREKITASLKEQLGLDEDSVEKIGEYILLQNQEKETLTKIKSIGAEISRLEYEDKHSLDIGSKGQDNSEEIKNRRAELQKELEILNMYRESRREMLKEDSSLKDVRKNLGFGIDVGALVGDYMNLSQEIENLRVEITELSKDENNSLNIRDSRIEYYISQQRESAKASKGALDTLDAHNEAIKRAIEHKKEEQRVSEENARIAKEEAEAIAKERAYSPTTQKKHINQQYDAQISEQDEIIANAEKELERLQAQTDEIKKQNELLKEQAIQKFDEGSDIEKELSADMNQQKIDFTTALSKDDEYQQLKSEYEESKSKHRELLRAVSLEKKEGSDTLGKLTDELNEETKRNGDLYNKMKARKDSIYEEVYSYNSTIDEDLNHNSKLTDSLEEQVYAIEQKEEAELAENQAAQDALKSQIAYAESQKEAIEAERAVAQEKLKTRLEEEKYTQAIEERFDAQKRSNVSKGMTKEQRLASFKVDEQLKVVSELDAKLKEIENTAKEANRELKDKEKSKYDDISEQLKVALERLKIFRDEAKELGLNISKQTGRAYADESVSGKSMKNISYTGGYTDEYDKQIQKAKDENDELKRRQELIRKSDKEHWDATRKQHQEQDGVSKLLKHQKDWTKGMTDDQKAAHDAIEEILQKLYKRKELDKDTTRELEKQLRIEQSKAKNLGLDISKKGHAYLSSGNRKSSSFVSDSGDQSNGASKTSGLATESTLKDIKNILLSGKVNIRKSEYKKSDKNTDKSTNAAQKNDKQKSKKDDESKEKIPTYANKLIAELNNEIKKGRSLANNPNYKEKTRQRGQQMIDDAYKKASSYGFKQNQNGKFDFLESGTKLADLAKNPEIKAKVDEIDKANDELTEEEKMFIMQKIDSVSDLIQSFDERIEQLRNERQGADKDSVKNIDDEISKIEADKSEANALVEELKSDLGEPIDVESSVKDVNKAVENVVEHVSEEFKEIAGNINNAVSSNISEDHKNTIIGLLKNGIADGGDVKTRFINTHLNTGAINWDSDLNDMHAYRSELEKLGYTLENIRKVNNKYKVGYTSNIVKIDPDAVTDLQLAEKILDGVYEDYKHVTTSENPSKEFVDNIEKDSDANLEKLKDIGKKEAEAHNDGYAEGQQSHSPSVAAIKLHQYFVDGLEVDSKNSIVKLNEIGKNDAEEYIKGLEDNLDANGVLSKAFRYENSKNDKTSAKWGNIRQIVQEAAKAAGFALDENGFIIESLDSVSKKANKDVDEIAEAYRRLQKNLPKQAKYKYLNSLGKNYDVVDSLRVDREINEDTDLINKNTLKLTEEQVKESEKYLQVQSDIEEQDKYHNELLEKQMERLTMITAIRGKSLSWLDINTSLDGIDLQKNTEEYRNSVISTREELKKLKEVFEGIKNNSFVADYGDAGLVNITEEDVDKLRNVIVKIEELKRVQNAPENINIEKGSVQYEKMLRNIKAEQSITTGATKAFKDKLERLKVELIDLATAGKLTKSELNRIGSSLSELQGVAKETGQEIDSLWVRLKKKVQDKSISALARYFSLYDIIRYVREAVNIVTEINSAQIELIKVSDATTAQLEQYWEHASESAKKYGATISEVINSASDWSRLGYNIEDAEKLTDATTLLLRVGDNMTQDSSSEGLISTLKGFGKTADEAEHIVDVVNQVANTEPIDTAGLFEGLEKSAASLNAAGNSYEQAVALITSANSVVQDPSSVGNAYKTKFLQNCLYVQKCA